MKLRIVYEFLPGRTTKSNDEAGPLIRYFLDFFFFFFYVPLGSSNHKQEAVSQCGDLITQVNGQHNHVKSSQ